jgi:hypothetical protein
MDRRQILRYFDRDYRNTYPHVVFPDGEEHLMQIRAVSSDNDSPSFLVSNAEIGSLRLNVCSKHKLKFIYPKTGSFQLGREGMFIVRDVDSRNYYRGPCEGNLKIFSIVEQFAVDFLTLSAAFKKIQFSFAEASALLKKDYLSVALKNNLVLSHSIVEKEGFSLHSRLGHVAEVTTDGNIKWSIPSIKSEVQECLMY